MTHNPMPPADPVRFIAVLEPARSDAGKKPSQLLKQLENPAHDAFEPERIVDPAAQQAARQQIKSLINKVREIIKAAAKMEEIDHSQLDELSHLFAAGGATTKAPDADAEKDPDRFKYGEARKSERKQAVTLGGKGKAKRPRGKDTEKKERKKAEKAERSRNRPAGVRNVPLEQVRSKIPQGMDERSRTIFFTPGASGNAEITVAASGLSDDVALTLAAVSAGVVVNGRVQAALVKGQRTAIDVTFSEPFAGPIELEASSLPAAAQEA